MVVFTNSKCGCTAVLSTLDPATEGAIQVVKFHSPPELGFVRASTQHTVGALADRLTSPGSGSRSGRVSSSD